MGDQLRLFKQERDRSIPSPANAVNVVDLNAKELAQQLAIASKYKRKSYKRRILAEAKRRGITL